MSVHKKSTNPYSFKQLLQNFKRKHAICSTLFNIISLCAPLILNLLDKIVLDNRSISTIIYILAWGLSIYTIVSSSLSTFYINRNTHDAYIPRFLDHIGAFSQGKFTMLSKEIHHKSKDPQKDILLYDAHAAVKDILSHLTYLVHDITGVDMENISVNFIYKYIGENEHWQTIDGTSSCSIGTLDMLVNHGPSTYHYLYANNHEYVYFNKKADADWHIYSPSMRDGEDRKQWGSIYCKRILCTLHQERIVDCILGISTYNEKFCTSRLKYNKQEIEHTINDAVNSFQNLLKIEMASLYLRHEHIKRREEKAILALQNALQKTPHCCRKKERCPLSAQEISALDESSRKQYLNYLTTRYKKDYHTKAPNVYAFDANLDVKDISDILYQLQN